MNYQSNDETELDNGKAPVISEVTAFSILICLPRAGAIAGNMIQEH